MCCCFSWRNLILLKIGKMIRKHTGIEEIHYLEKRNIRLTHPSKLIKKGIYQNTRRWFSPAKFEVLLLFLERPTREATLAMEPRLFLPSTLPCSAAESEILPSFFSYMYMSVLLVLRLRGLRVGAGWCSCILAVKALCKGGWGGGQKQIGMIGYCVCIRLFIS